MPRAQTEDAKQPKVEWLNFFVADVQTGLGPFLAAYLAAGGWNPSRVGFALTFGGLVTVALQTPAGAIIDASRNKRLLVAVNLIVLACGAVLLMGRLKTTSVFTAQFLIGASAAFLTPSIAAITLGLVGSQRFDRQFGRNQGFNSAGNVVSALLIALVSYKFGFRDIFVTAALFTIPSLICLFSIDGSQIDFARSRGSSSDGKDSKAEGVLSLLKDHSLLFFLLAVFLFHLSNAAMLPQLGEMLARGKLQNAAPLMSACIIVTQLVIAITAAWVGKRAMEKGRKQLLVIGFGVLPIRGILYTLTHATAALIGIQLLDGIANSIFVIVSILVIKDLTQGTGRFNLAAGALATMVGIGAALSNAMGGLLIQHFSYNVSFLGLAATGLVAVSLLYFKVPETLHGEHRTVPSET
jgi:predicted MFS family arabinose efflux permease